METRPLPGAKSAASADAVHIRFSRSVAKTSLNTGLQLSSCHAWAIIMAVSSLKSPTLVGDHGEPLMNRACWRQAVASPSHPALRRCRQIFCRCLSG